VLFTDASRSNLIVSPQLRGISRAANNGLDPRPASGSPALAGNTRTTPVGGFYTAADYQGAFGQVNWASDWTAVGTYAVMTGSGAGVPRAVSGGSVTPTAPVLGVTSSAGMLTISFASQVGVNYRVQSATVLVPGATVWSNESGILPGTGATISYNATIGGGDPKFYQVEAQ